MRHPWPLLALLACQHEIDGLIVDTDPSDDGPQTCFADIMPPAPPACGSGPVARGAWIPGPASDGHDASLAAKALAIERQFHALAAWSTGVNTEMVVPVDDTDARAAIADFLAGNGWDFEAATGRTPEATVSWQKAAGGYAGVGIAADALRYGVLRDEGAPCDAVDQARQHLLRSLEGLHRAVAITGTPGVIARGYARTDHPGYGQVVETVPLFNDDGAPLPVEKDNGTWREDVSGAYPDYVWEDSCSRDMFMGWVTGFALSWEVIRHDDTIPDAVKATLQADALDLAISFSTTRESGYDLEIVDADGRRTYHGILHEESIDRIYAPGVANGQNAMMALGAAAALAMVSEDLGIEAWVQDELVDRRALHEVARASASTVDFGLGSNFSGYNMNFLGGLLGTRYLCDDDARAVLAEAVDTSQYAIPGKTRQPEEQGQTLYDLAAAMARTGSWLGGSGSALDDTLDLGLTTLTEWPAPPHYLVGVDPCDGDETPGIPCTAPDGTTYTSLGRRGRNGVWIAEEPVAMRHRAPSNYYWRSNPYQLQSDGSPATISPSVDFRIAYWLGRWVRE